MNGPKYYSEIKGWPGKGEFVWWVLPYKQAYKPVQPPTPPYGCDPTTTNMVSNDNPAVIGDTITFTATVVDADEAVGPTAGAVNFYDGPNLLGTATLNTSDPTQSTATFNTANLASGSHNMRGIYTGGAGWMGSEGDLTQTVNDSCTPQNSSDNLESIASGQDNIDYGSTYTYDPSGEFITTTATKWRLSLVYTQDNADGSHNLAGTVVATGAVIGGVAQNTPTSMTIKHFRTVPLGTGPYQGLASWVVVQYGCGNQNYVPVDFGIYGQWNG